MSESVLDGPGIVWNWEYEAVFHFGEADLSYALQNGSQYPCTQLTDFHYLLDISGLWYKTKYFIRRNDQSHASWGANLHKINFINLYQKLES